MSVVRSGEAIDLQGSAYRVADGTDNDATAPRLINTGGEPMRPVLVTNWTSASLYVKVNKNYSSGSTVNDFNNSSDDDGTGYWSIGAGLTQDVSLGGLIQVEEVSFVTTAAGADLDAVSVVGWKG